MNLAARKFLFRDSDSTRPTSRTFAFRSRLDSDLGASALRDSISFVGHPCRRDKLAHHLSSTRIDYNNMQVCCLYCSISGNRGCLDYQAGGISLNDKLYY